MQAKSWVGALVLAGAWSAGVQATPLDRAQLVPVGLAHGELTRASSAPSLQAHANAATLAIGRLEDVSRTLTPRWHPAGGRSELSVVPLSPSSSLGFTLRLATP